MNYTKEWNTAVDIRKWYESHKGKKWTLEFVDMEWAAYGNWRLYVDPETGIYYKEYESIGD